MGKVNDVSTAGLSFRPWRRRSRMRSASASAITGAGGGGGVGGSGAGFLAPRSFRLNDTSSIGMSDAADGRVLNLAPSSFSPEIESRGENCDGGKGGGGGKGARARGIGGCDDDLGGSGATGFLPGLGEGLGTEWIE